MAKSPLPLLFAAGAFFYLKKKRASETVTETPETKEKPKTDDKGDEEVDDGELPAPGDNKTGEPDPKDGSVSTIPAPGYDDGYGDPGGDPPVAVETSNPSGYSDLTIGQMIVIQSQLDQLGYNPGDIDGKWSYNGTTFGAVWDFQTNYGLTIDGKPGNNTQDTLDEVIDGTWVAPGAAPSDPTKPSGYSDLTIGQMKTIQNQLVQLGHDPGEIDGKWKYGGNTYDAIREFQVVYGLQVDGKPGPNTQTMIDVAIDGQTDPVAPVGPTVDPLPEPVPADDPTLFVISTKLAAATIEVFGFEKPMILIEQVRSTGLGQPKGFASGYDIYQDQRTLGNDGRFIGVAMAKTNDAESNIWVYRSEPTAVIASADGRVNQLAGKLEWLVGVLKNKMT